MIVALVFIILVAVNAPFDNKATQEITSSKTSIEATQSVKPKKQAIKKDAQVDFAKQKTTKEIVKSESTKAAPTNLSSPEQRSNQSNFLYYVLGFLTLGLISVYFYFRKGSQTADAKIYTSDELKQSLQKTPEDFKSQSTSNEQAQSNPKSNTDQEIKK